MKNLKMNLQQLGNVEVLTRSQMKNVVGGLRDDSGLPDDGGKV